MPACLESGKRYVRTKKNIQQCSSPERPVRSVPNSSPYSPEVYKKKIDIGSCGIPYAVIVLDEKIDVIDAQWMVITQWILGHHDKLPFALRHQGWQGGEMIRKINRYEIDFRDGNKKIVEREIDISVPIPRTCNRWGRPLN